MPYRIIRLRIVQAVQPYILIARLVEEAGGPLPAAKAMNAPSFQPTLHKIVNGNVSSPQRQSAERIAKHFRIPVEAVYDPKVAAQVYRQRFGEGAAQDEPAMPEGNAEGAGHPPPARAVPVRGTAKLGEGGFYEEVDDDGVVDSYSTDPDAFALRVKGDSMHPAIRHGHFVVVEPNGRCVPGEYVAIELMDGQKMVKELVFDRPQEVVVESANGNRRLTFERAEIRHMYPITSIVSPSKWREV